MNDSVEMIKDLAVHDVEIKHLQDDMDKMVKEMAEIKKSLASIETVLSEAKGGWRTLMWVGGAGTAFGTLVGWIIEHTGK
jgi:prefoldin subunit 5